MYVWDHAYDTPYGQVDPENSGCAQHRPRKERASSARRESTPVGPQLPGAVFMLSNFFNAGLANAPIGHDGSFNTADFLYRAHLQHCERQPTIIKTDWIFNPQRSRHELLAVQGCLNTHGLEYCVDEWKSEF